MPCNLDGTYLKLGAGLREGHDRVGRLHDDVVQLARERGRVRPQRLEVGHLRLHWIVGLPSLRFGGGCHNSRHSIRKIELRIRNAAERGGARGERCGGVWGHRETSAGLGGWRWSQGELGGARRQVRTSPKEMSLRFIPGCLRGHQLGPPSHCGRVGAGAQAWRMLGQSCVVRRVWVRAPMGPRVPFHRTPRDATG